MISLKVLLFFLFQVGCGLGETFEKIRPLEGPNLLSSSCETPLIQNIMQKFNPTWNDNFIYAVDVCFHMPFPIQLFKCEPLKKRDGDSLWTKNRLEAIILTLRLAKDEKKFVNLSLHRKIRQPQICAHFDIETISNALKKSSIPRDKVILYGAVTFPEGVVTRISREKDEKFSIQLRGTGSFLASEHDFKKRRGEFPYTTIYNFAGSDGKGLEPIFNQTAEKETFQMTVDGRVRKIETFRRQPVLPEKENNTLETHIRGWEGTCSSDESLNYDPEELEKDIVKNDINTKDSIPKDSIPKDSIPKDSIPKDSIPKDSIPKDSIPKDSIPKDSIPKDSIPEGSTTGHTTKSVSNFSSIIMILTLMTLSGL